MLGEWTENLMNLSSNCRHDFSKMWFCVSSGHLVVVSLWPIFDQIGFLMQTRVHSQGAISRFIANGEKELIEFLSATLICLEN